MYAARSRYHDMMGSVKDFVKTHNVPQDLAERVIDYVTSTWAITKGIDTAKVGCFLDNDGTSIQKKKLKFGLRYVIDQLCSQNSSEAVLGLLRFNIKALRCLHKALKRALNLGNHSDFQAIMLVFLVMAIITRITHQTYFLSRELRKN